MYDTTGFHLINKYSQDCLKYLDQGKDEIDRQTGLIWSKGKIENMYVKVNGEHISTSGSLPKFYLGNNLEQLTRKDTERAIEKLSDILHLPLNESRVFKLHIGSNFIVTEPLLNYYSCLGHLNRFQRSEIANKKSILYTTSDKALEFYDKKKEAKKSKTEIPEPLRTQNILRYELKLSKHIPGLLKTDELKAKDLFDETVYMKSIELWQSYYFAIQKITKLKFKGEIIEMIGVKELQSHLALIGLKTIGENELFQMLESYKKKINKHDYSRIRKKINDLANLSELTEPNEAIQELDKKVKMAVKHYR
jgi:hypothetical protein